MATAAYLALQRIQQGRSVRRHLTASAQRVAARARAVAAAEGADVEVTVTDGTRPRGRSYARVSMTPGVHEFGDSKTSRKRILGQAVAGS